MANCDLPWLPCEVVDDWAGDEAGAENENLSIVFCKINIKETHSNLTGKKS